MTATEQPVSQPVPEYSQPTPKKPGNGLGVAALIVGIVGFIFALIPLIGLVGGFIAFVGLVLGIVALFLKGKSKGTAIAGTIISGVALILSIVMSAVYAAAFVAAVEENLPDTPAIVEEGGEAEEEAPAEEAPADDALGTRANPAPLGTSITIEGGDGVDWEITPLAADLDYTDEVKAANEFNPDPESGNQYAMLNVNVKYVGPDSGSPSELIFTYVSAEGREYNGSFVVMDGQLSDVTELFAPGEAEGTVIIEIPAEGAADGVWGVEYIFGEPFFFAAE